MVMRDLFREGRNIDADRVHTEHHREQPARPAVIICKRLCYSAQIFRALFRPFRFPCTERPGQR